ncbi:MAG TPA: peptide ABC transporter permease [Synergistaceae bacterium]|nr:peptide ABC transporter permease [Synergistaceae bacterium]
MGRFVAQRLLMLVPVLLGVSLVAFCIIQLSPGDPAQVMAGMEASEADIEMIREKFGLNEPLPVQYWAFLKGLFSGNLVSLRYEAPVMEIVLPHLKNTLILASMSIVLAVLLGVATGVCSAVMRKTWVDYLATVLALFGVSMPVFWWGLLLMLLFSVKLAWLPSGGMGTFAHLILPSVALGTSSAGIIARMTRSSMLDVLKQDYITTATAKGLVRSVVVGRHALRNALIPTVTVIGLQFGQLLAGAVLTETVFSWPGVGRLLVTSILSRDFPMVQATLVIVAALFVFVNLAVDMLYAVLDPRIRYHGR